MTPAERAVYLELDHHLQAMEMKAKKSIKSKKTSEGDRESRLRDMLGASGSAEEALLKRCSHYDLAGNTKSAEAACQEVCKVREEQLKGCEADLQKAVQKVWPLVAQFSFSLLFIHELDIGFTKPYGVLLTPRKRKRYILFFMFENKKVFL